MKETAIVMPKMGESVIEATILQWFKKEGETVKEGELLLEVATDKVDAEVPATQAGTIKKLLAKEGDVVGVGAPIAFMNVATVVNTPAAIEVPTQAVTVTPQQRAVRHQLVKRPLVTQEPLPSHGLTARRLYSPLVRRIAQQTQLSPQELAQIPGTAKNNRVTKQDILAYLKNRLPTNTAASSMRLIDNTVLEPGDEVIQMDRVRRIIAERMVASKQIVPQVTSVVSVDVTNIVHWKKQHKTAFKQKTGIDLTYTPILLEAIVKALQAFPMINAIVIGEQIIKKKAIHIGLAVALPDNNLVVPVIKNAAQLTLSELANCMQKLVHKARTYQLTPDMLTGATYTVSNIGSFQNLIGTPIIMQPQVAILALGTIVKRPAVLTTLQGDTIAIRHEMLLSHTYDHRFIDGALGGMFAKKVGEYLEAFDTTRNS